MNTELALAALKAAKENPERFNMDSFWTGGGFTKDSADMTAPPCGTTGCYAGFASLLAAPPGTRILPMDGWRPSRIVEPTRPVGTAPETEDYAIKALGITYEQASCLFYLQDVEEVDRAVHYLIDHPDADYDELLRLVEGVS